MCIVPLMNILKKKIRVQRIALWIHSWEMKVNIKKSFSFSSHLIRTSEFMEKILFFHNCNNLKYADRKNVLNLSIFKSAFFFLIKAFELCDITIPAFTSSKFHTQNYRFFFITHLNEKISNKSTRNACFLR